MGGWAGVVEFTMSAPREGAEALARTGEIGHSADASELRLTPPQRRWVGLRTRNSSHPIKRGPDPEMMDAPTHANVSGTER